MGAGGMGGAMRMRPSSYGGSSGPNAKGRTRSRWWRAYSPETNEWVGEVELRYSGSDPDEAIWRNSTRAIGKLVPGAHCTGWT